MITASAGIVGEVVVEVVVVVVVLVVDVAAGLSWAMATVATSAIPNRMVVVFFTKAP
jgi:hypothetical protein